MKKDSAPNWRKHLGEIGSHKGYGATDLFADFVNMTACALSIGRREEEYLQTVKRHDKKTLNGIAECFAQFIEEAEEKPFEDLLGPAHMDWASDFGKKRGGEFYTPQHLCRAMAQLSFDKSAMKESEPITVLEPACGSGAMILAFAHTLVESGFCAHNMRATAIDVSKVACDMCFVNCSLWGIPCEVIHGDAVGMNYWASHRNIWYPLACGTNGETFAPSSPKETVPAALAAARDKNGQLAMAEFLEAVS